MLSKARFVTFQKQWIGLHRHQDMYRHLNHQKMAMSNAAMIQTSLLPHLPVPKLNQTVEKYLKSVEPFLNESETNHTKKLLAQLQSESGIGAKLQKLLVQRAQETDNWLAEWWLNTAYLQYRDSVVVYSSPGLVFPLKNFSNLDEQLVYAAYVINGALSYKSVIDSEKMPSDMMGKDPLDMNQYKKIFGTCRLPGLKQDNLEYNPQSKHIVIVKNNNFFKLNVINENGQIPTEKLINALHQIVADAQVAGPSVGILTTDNRNNWGKAYQDLILDLTNLRSVREIQTSLFLVCLDKSTAKSNKSRRTIASEQLIHGGGSNSNSSNRWYDKTVQFVVSEDGVVGLTYEHSPSEGQPIAVMTDYVVSYIENKRKSIGNDEFSPKPEKLIFHIDDKINKAIESANEYVNKLANNLNMDAFQFNQYGKEFVKSQKMSPDSFIQMAMQFAFYRIHKVPGAHYESAATRKYIHGRTETIRSCSLESIAFAKAMLDNSKSDGERVAALKKAVEAHKKYSIEAVNGFGVDRHLLGLKLAAIENQLPVPEIFSDPSFIRSTHMRLSTSQVATNCDGFMCYAPLVPDGYGCCYNPRKNDINFAVSAFTEHPDITALQFRGALETSLHDMHNILVKTQKAKL